MNRFKYLFFFLSFIPSAFAYSEIIECSHFSELCDQLPKNALVFMEIDNILLRPKTEVAKTEFLEHLREKLLLDGYGPDAIAGQLYPLWVKIQKKSQFDALYLNQNQDFNRIKEKSSKVFGLSHRGPQLSHVTSDALHHHQIFFDSHHSFKRSKLSQPGLAAFYEGILLVHPVGNMGQYLEQFLDQHEGTFTKVVCIDYKLVNLVEVDQVMQKRGIPFLGIYFRGSDLKTSQYTIDIGQIQLEYIDKILSDEVAQVILGKLPCQ